MAFFFCRLNPPRPDFATTTTDAERTLMRTHAAYLTEKQRAGPVVLFGPVGDPAGAWGLCILECADEAEARAITDNDPTVKSGRGFHYDVHPILSANLRSSIRQA